MRLKHSPCQLVSTLKSKPPKAFLASITERVRLNPRSDKETYHLVLDLSGSGIDYRVGDCIGVHPQNDPALVSALVDAAGDPTLHDFLLKEANLYRIPKKLLVGHPDLITLLKNAPPDPTHLRDKLLPLLPRFYSIASSATHVKNEVHLTIARVTHGACSGYLCERAPLHEPIVPIFVQKSKHFYLPPESRDAPIIMIGPGTGIAPFRGFMQERTHDKNWLFFGERYYQKDFYYQEFWETLVTQERLKLTTAFSRDQAEKIYVQHKMLQHSKELWEWLESGAYLFVCGDASKMAKDVHKTLLEIIQTEGNLSSEEAKTYIKKLKAESRYQRDVY